MQLVNILCKLAQFYIPKKWQLSTEHFAEIRYCHRVSVTYTETTEFFHIYYGMHKLQLRIFNFDTR